MLKKQIHPVCFFHFINAVTKNDMIFLLLSILSSTLIFIIFKVAQRFRIDIFQLILINYVVATSLGANLFSQKWNLSMTTSPWFPFAMLIGILFILLFFLIGKSTQKAGMSTTTLAAKMSVVVPVAYSIIIYNEKVDWLKGTGIALALVAVFMVIYKQGIFNNIQKLLLPLLIFLGSGLVDSMVKYAQHHLQAGNTALFSTVLFATAAFAGIIIALFRPLGWRFITHLPTLILGVALGAVNFGSLFFLMKALASKMMDSSVIFGLNNLAIVALSTLVGMTFYREKLSNLNRTGLLLAFISIFILIYV